MNIKTKFLAAVAAKILIKKETENEAH